MKLFENLTTGTFIRRPHRFCLVCNINGVETECYLPNPGRLSELLFVGVKVYLEASKNPAAKQPFVAIAIESTLDSTKTPVMLHTHKTNDVAEFLIQNKLIPSFKNATVKAREVKYKNSRFDILLLEKNKDIMVEVKSCTLFHKKTAMFPDAVTSRGKKHVEELVELSKSGTKTAIIFIVHSHNVSFFCPDYHTDPEFSKALYDAKDSVKIIPVSVKYKKDLSLDTNYIKELPIMWNVYKTEALDKGIYLLSIEIKKDLEINNKKFKKGYYLYMNTAKKELFKTIEKYKRKKSKPLTCLEELRKNSSSFKALAINTPKDISKELNNEILNIAREQVLDFALTGKDFNEAGTLYYFKENPIGLQSFQEILLDFQMNKPFKKQKN